jgi:peptide/nickel transport system substrate-binding protein
VAARQAWGDLAYQNLVMFDENLRVTPCLAETWTAASPTRWTFTLRQGVTFHDGSEFSAEDVTFWFERLTAGEPRGRGTSWLNIAKVEPKGKYVVDLVLDEPYAPLLASLASLRGSAIVSRRSATSPGAASTGPAMGTGPFRIAEVVPNSRVRFVRHPEYWERGLPYLDEITVRTVPDEAERMGLLQTADVSAAILAPEPAARLKSEKGVAVQSSTGPLQRVTVLNTRRKPFDDPKVRQAVALTVDRRLALERVLAGEGRLTGPIPQGHGGWSAADAPAYRRDPVRAKQLLAESGHADGLEATIKVSAADPTAMPLATLMADELREIGVNLKVEQLGPSALARSVEVGDFDLCGDVVEFQPDPDGYLRARYHSASPLNRSGFRSERFDDLIERARTLFDPVERKRLYDEAATVLLDESPTIWWFAENNVEPFRANVKGYGQSFTGRRPFLKRTWLDR